MNRESRAKHSKEQLSDEMRPMKASIIGSWVYPGAHKAYVVCEANDVTALVKMTLPSSDLWQFEIVPVIETQELMKMVGNPT